MKYIYNFDASVEVKKHTEETIQNSRIAPISKLAQITQTFIQIMIILEITALCKSRTFD